MTDQIRQQEPWMTDITPDAFEAIGRFVVMCSAIEVSVHAVLKHLLHIEDELVRLLVKESRMDDLQEYLGFTARFRKLHKDQLSALDLLKQQIVYLNAVRSLIAHKPVIQRNDGTLIFHNAMTAKRVASIIGYECSTERLRNAEQYGIRLIHHLLDLDIGGKTKPTEFLEQVRQLCAWRDKLPLPTNPADKTQQSPGPTLLPRPSWPTR